LKGAAKKPPTTTEKTSNGLPDIYFCDELQSARNLRCKIFEDPVQSDIQSLVDVIFALCELSTDV